MVGDLPDWVIAAVVGVLGTGGIGALQQARTSRQIGVREQDVVADKNSGDLALELIRDLRGQIKDLQDQGKVDATNIEAQDRRGRRLEAVLERINDGLRETVAALDDLIHWQATGAIPPPPWRLEDLRARLARLMPKEDRDE